VAAEGEGYSVAVDVPFADALVSLSSDQKDRRILSAMQMFARHDSLRLALAPGFESQNVEWP
jgi:hypothetical protein